MKGGKYGIGMRGPRGINRVLVRDSAGSLIYGWQFEQQAHAALSQPKPKANARPYIVVRGIDMGVFLFYLAHRYHLPLAVKLIRSSFEAEDKTGPITKEEILEISHSINLFEDDAQALQALQLEHNKDRLFNPIDSSEDPAVDSYLKELLEQWEK